MIDAAAACGCGGVANGRRNAAFISRSASSSLYWSFVVTGDPHMAKPQGRCMFCNGFGLSKEHLFADWLRNLFPRLPDDTHTIGTADGTPWNLTRHQGHSGTKKIRTVCEPCNTGWISGIDEAASYVVPNLIKAQQTPISIEMQSILSVWFAKIAMVGDSRNPQRRMVPQTQRDSLKATKLPPESWEIWIAVYGGTDYRDLGLYQHGGQLDLSSVAKPSIKFSGYLQSTFIGMGSLAALVIGNDMPDFSFEIGSLRHFFRRIWPVTDVIDWPWLPVMWDLEANAASHIIKRMIANPRN